jgi:alkylhydroperoxidase family enzyme
VSVLRSENKLRTLPCHGVPEILTHLIPEILSHPVIRRASDESSIDYTNVPEALRGMYQLEHYIHYSGCLEESLVHLVKMRAPRRSMGVRIAVDLHSKDARALGETEQRLYVLGAWEEARFYSERERAALALTDAVNPDHGRSFA